MLKTEPGWIDAMPLPDDRATRDARSVRRVRVAFWSLGAVIGLLQAWRARFWINPDGIAYLDHADAWLRGDWREAVSPYWSPFYSWLLGIAMLSRPSPYWEFAVVHLVGFLVFLGSFASFEFFLRGVVLLGRGPWEDAPPDMTQPLPEWVLRVWGYTLFLVGSLEFVSVSIATPDMAVTACVYLAAGIVTRLASRPASIRLHVFLGLVLGVGYLVKAAMLPVAVVFIGVAAVAAGDPRKAVSRTVVSALVVAIFVTPFAAALSLKEGRVTLGDSGKMNYAWLVNRVPFLFDQPGVPTITLRGGTAWPEGLIHPPRVLLDRPLVLEFATPIPGTIPLLDELSYWYGGLTPRFSLGSEARAVLASAKAFARVLGRLAWFLGALLLLSYLGARRPSWVLSRSSAVVLGPAVGALGIYGVVWVEPRYVAAFVVLAAMGALLGVRVADGVEQRRAVRGITIGVALLTVGPLVVGGLETAVSEIRAAVDAPGARHEHWQTAQALHAMGIRPGEEIAAIGRFEDFAWARLARVRIIAAIGTDAALYWEAEPRARARANETLARTGAKLIVASRGPGSLDEIDRWTRLGHTSYYASRVDRP